MPFVRLHLPIKLISSHILLNLVPLDYADAVSANRVKNVDFIRCLRLQIPNYHRHVVVIGIGKQADALRKKLIRLVEQDVARLRILNEVSLANRGQGGILHLPNLHLLQLLLLPGGG